VGSSTQRCQQIQHTSDIMCIARPCAVPGILRRACSRGPRWVTTGARPSGRARRGAVHTHGGAPLIRDRADRDGRARDAVVQRPVRCSDGPLSRGDATRSFGPAPMTATTTARSRSVTEVPDPRPARGRSLTPRWPSLGSRAHRLAGGAQETTPENTYRDIKVHWSGREESAPRNLPHRPAASARGRGLEPQHRPRDRGQRHRVQAVDRGGRRQAPRLDAGGGVGRIPRVRVVIGQDDVLDDLHGA
jgi:hypothetical protein